MLADQGPGATIDDREFGSGPVHRVLTSPEEINELFVQTANPELAEQALSKLLNICGFQSFHVSIEQLSHLMNILSSRITENMVRKTLSLLRELSEFRSPQIMNFLCQNESIMVIYSFFPNPVSARILSRCVEYSGDVRAYLLQKFASDPVSFEKLLTTTDPYTLEDMPALAESWSVRTAGEGDARHTELVFRLKRGLKWSDGSPLTARDMKASVDFIKSNKLPRFFDSVKNVRRTETPDDYTLRVVMEGVSYWYLDNIGGLPCFPKKVLDRVTDWQNWDPLSEDAKFGPRGLLGCGPFTLESYKPGEYVMMRRNPHYRLLEGVR